MSLYFILLHLECYLACKIYVNVSMYVGLCKWGDVIEWCNEAVCGVTACIILTSGCCAWIPYHIESAIKYAPPPGYAITYIRWVLNILTQDVVHTVTSWAVGAGCSGGSRPIWRGAQGCRHIHTYILTDWMWISSARQGLWVWSRLLECMYL